MFTGNKSKSKKSKTGIKSKSASRREERKKNPKITQGDPYERQEMLKKSVTPWKTVNDMPAGEAWELIFNFKPEVNLFPDDIHPRQLTKLNARDWWERADPTQQCTNIINEPLEYGTTRCYICGFIIHQEAQCEHVLSVYKAAMYLTLYRSEFKYWIHKPDEELTDEQRRMKNEMKLEYKWAHRCCNQIKSDIDFTMFNGRFYVPNEKKMRYVLNTIHDLNNGKGSNENCKDALLKQDINGIARDKNKFVENRIKILNGEKPVKNNDYSQDTGFGAVSEIIEYMNSDETLRKGNLLSLHLLTSISKSISAVDQEQLWRVWNHGTNIQKERVLRKVKTKSDIITEVVPTISQFLNYSFPRLYVPEGLDKNKVITEFYKAILGSYPDVEVGRDTRKINFNAMTLLSVNQVVNSAYPIFDEMFTLTQHDGLVLFEDEASEISGLTLSIFILMIYLKRVISTELVSSNTRTLVDFVEPFRTAINEELQKTLGYFDDNEKKCKFLAIIKYLFSRIFREDLPSIIDTIIAGYGCRDVFTETNYIEAIASYYSDENKSINIDINTLIDSLSNTDPTQDLKNATVIGLTARRVLELERAPYLGEYDKQKRREELVDKMMSRGKERRLLRIQANRENFANSDQGWHLVTANRHANSVQEKSNRSRESDNRTKDANYFSVLNSDSSDSEMDEEKGGRRTEKKYPRHSRRMQKGTKKMKKQAKTLKKSNNRRKTHKHKRH